MADSGNILDGLFIIVLVLLWAVAVLLVGWSFEAGFRWVGQRLRWRGRRGG